MRIVSTSTSAYYDRARADMKALRAHAEDLQSQIGTGERLSRSSDDPLAASRLRGLLRADRLAAVDTNNADRAVTDLSLADSAVSAIADALVRAKELAVQASSDSLADEQRRAIAVELESIHASIFALSNARDSNGHALFGGQSAGDAYALDGSGSAVYIGTASAGTLQLGERESVVRGVTGPEVLSFDFNGAPTDLLATIRTLALAMNSGAPDASSIAGDSLGALDAGLDKVTTAQTVIGTRLAWLEVSGERRLDLAEARANESADIGATDVAGSVTRLQEMLVVLEASQASFTRLAELSLFDRLR